MTRIRTLLLFVTCLLLAACSRSESSGKVSVWVSIAPQAYFVEQIAGDLVEVNVLLRAGQSPETYSPSAAKLAQVFKAKYFFGIGMPIERPIRSAMESGTQSVAFVQTGLPLSDDTDTHHVHGPHCAHGHNGEDPHIWVDPIRMIEITQMIEDHLVKTLPESAEVLRANGAALKASLLALDAELKSQLAPYAGKGFFINHPSLGHFAERYGVVQYSIEVAGTSPSARRIADLLAMAKAFEVKAVLTQPEFGRSSAEVLARELGVEVRVVDPLAFDYPNNLRQIAASIVKGMQHE